MAAQPATETTKVEGLHGITDPKINLDGLNSVVKRVNILLATATSVEGAGNTQPTSLSKLRAVVDDARSALGQAASLVNRAVLTLSKEAREKSIRIPTVVDKFDWYEHMDLFALAEEDLKTMLKAHPPTDVDDFAEFVLHTTYKRLCDHANEECVLDAAFARKALQLICALLSSNGGAVAGFHQLVSAKIELLRPECDSPVSVKDIESLDDPLQRAIEWMLKQGNYEGGSKFKIDDDLEFQCTFVPSYLDAASARRSLRDVWAGHDCSLDECVEQVGDGEPYGQCWHKRNEKLMLLLNRAAYQEVKRTVWTATQHVLPPELVEEIFEYALLVERIPIDANLREKSAGRHGRIKKSYRTHECRVWK
ncbi:hypothetical protein LTR17_015178 [Elasticomyces elasticus]|nr:hypothetical protein LTR17_015178 [Elasticomyces elasticus]